MSYAFSNKRQRRHRDHVSLFFAFRILKIFHAQFQPTVSFWILNWKKKKIETKSHLPHSILIPPARDGYFIFCYGDCNRKYEEALAARSANTGDSLMKKFWLELYNRQYKHWIYCESKFELILFLLLCVLVNVSFIITKENVCFNKKIITKQNNIIYVL